MPYLQTSEIFNIYDKAIILYGREKTPPPACSFCKKVTGYMQEPLEKKPILTLLAHCSLFSFFLLDGFYYLPINNCAKCAGTYTGKKLCGYPAIVIDLEKSQAKKNLDKTEYIQWLDGYNIGVMEKMAELRIKEKEAKNGRNKFAVEAVETVAELEEEVKF